MKRDLPTTLDEAGRAIFVGRKMVDLAADLPNGEQRRPGRIENVSPKLIPLLRGQVELLPDHDDREPYDLTAATGAAVGLLICGPLWVLILWVLGITFA